MNNSRSNWKCPNCDTINLGRRCVVCGQEKPDTDNLSPLNGGLKNTIPEKKRKSKKSVILISALAASAVIALIILLIVSFSSNREKEEEKIPPKPVSHELVVDKKEEHKEVFLTDSIFDIKFNLSLDKHEMDKHPDFVEKNREKISYVVPMNFRNSGGNRYFAYDESAYLAFGYADNPAGKSADELMKEEKTIYGETVAYEVSGDDWYVISTEIDGVIYYRKEKVNPEKKVSFVFVYPAEYRDIYDDYVETIADGLDFPDTSGVEVIEE